MLKSNLAIILMGGFLGFAAGCSDNTPACLPETVVVGCICNTGNWGYQVCSSDGLGLGACICGTPPPDAAVVNEDAEATPDAPATSDAGADEVAGGESDANDAAQSSADTGGGEGDAGAGGAAGDAED
jgi:hypothetical protein